MARSAVFHFLIEPNDQAGCLALATRTVKPNVILIVGAFGSDGLENCSGLPVHRYDGDSLARVFANKFHLKQTVLDEHRTHSGVRQPFVYVVQRC